MSISLKTHPDQNMIEPRMNERGAALLTVAVILLLVSIMIVFGMKMFRTEDSVDRRSITQEQLHSVMSQIAAYAQREKRLPCPARPDIDPETVAFGFEDRDDDDGNPVTPSDRACNRTVGIIPFRTLHMNKDKAYDGWGRFVTYAVSPVFTDTRTAAGDNDIFYICRKEDVWSNKMQPAPRPTPPWGATISNPRKARFCCPSPYIYDPDTDLVIENEHGDMINLRPDQGTAPAVRTDNGDAHGSIIAPSATSDPDIVSEPMPAALSNNRNVVSFAVTLISHGPNGHGAYDGAGPNTQFALAGAGTDEIENGNQDNVFVDRPAVLPDGAGHFDDIVLWRDQFSLYNSLNNASCTRPWR